MGAKLPKSQGTKPAKGVDVSTTAYGEVIAVNFGRCMVTPRLIWMGKLQHQPAAGIVFKTPGSGFGAAHPTNDQYIYFVSLQWAIGEGPIEGIRTLYKRDTFITLADFDHVGDDGVIRPPNFGGRIFPGSEHQPAWRDSYDRLLGSGRKLWTSLTPGHVGSTDNSIELAYPFLASLGRLEWPLYQQAQLPNLTFEGFCIALEQSVRDWSLPTEGIEDGPPQPTFVPHASSEATYTDSDGEHPVLKVGANPADIIQQILTNPVFGMDWPGSEALDDYRTACLAHGFLMGVPCDSQRAAREWISDILEQSNSLVRMSNGALEVLPLWDSVTTGPVWAAPQDQVKHTPKFLQQNADGSYSIQVCYSLTDDDFIGDLSLEYPDPADAENIHTIEYLDRRDDYTAKSVEAKDQASVDEIGAHEASTFQAHYLTDSYSAQELGETRVRAAVSGRPTAKFTVDFRYSRLEVGDLLALTHTRRKLSNFVVRISSLKENDTGQRIDVEADQVITGLNTVVRYPRQASLTSSADPDFSGEPGKIFEPVLFEPTAELTGGDLELWIAADGQEEQWGGATVWMSEDGGVTYEAQGRITDRARMGKLQAAMTDTSTSLDVQLRAPAGSTVELEVQTIADAIRFKAQLYIDGGDTSLRVPYEVLSYIDPALTAPNRYTLSGLRRGGFGTPDQLHRAGANVVRIDDPAIFKLALPARLVGVPLKFKLTSFNRYGGGEQALEDVAELTYVVRGTYLWGPVAQATNLAAQFVDVTGGARLYLTWDPVADYRGVVEYEIRKGSQGWARAVVLGTTRETRFEVVSDGVYWVAARVAVSLGGDPQFVYGEPYGIPLKESAETASNIVGGADELAMGWSDFASLVITDAPLAYWRMSPYPGGTLKVFDEVTPGTSAGSYTLTVPDTQMFQPGGAVVNDLFPNSAYVYTAGGGDRITLTRSVNDLNRDEFTLIFWAQWSGLGTSQAYLYSKGTGAWITVEASGVLRWLAQTSGSQILGGSNFRDGQMHMIALSFRRFDAHGMETRLLELTMDGLPEGAINGATFPVTTGTTYFGDRGSPVSGSFNGYFDEYALIPQYMNHNQLRSWWRAAREFGPGVYRSYVMAAKPLTYCRFNEAPTSRHIIDQMGGPHPLIASTETSFVPGLLNGDDDQAVDFTGVSGSNAASVGFPVGANLLQVALECVFQPDAVASGYVQGIYTNGPFIAVKADGSIEAHFPKLDTTDQVVATPPGAYSAGQRLHVVAGCDATFGLLVLVVNGGTPIVAPATIGAPIATGAQLICAEAPLTGFSRFAGVVDEIALYNHGLTIDRIAAHAMAAQFGQHITNLEVTSSGYLRATPKMSGYYQIPDAHIVTLARRMLVRINVGWDAVAVDATSIRDAADFGAIGQVNVVDAANLITARPEISISDDLSGDDWTGGDTRPEWAPYKPGSYLVGRVRLRVFLESKVDGIVAELRALTWTVEAPDYTLTGRVTTSVSGVVHVTYPKAFYPIGGNPGLVVTPRAAGVPTQIEQMRVTNETTTGFDLDVVTTGGMRLVRDFTWQAAGF